MKRIVRWGGGGGGDASLEGVVIVPPTWTPHVDVVAAGAKAGRMTTKGVMAPSMMTGEGCFAASSEGQ